MENSDSKGDLDVKPIKSEEVIIKPEIEDSSEFENNG